MNGYLKNAKITPQILYNELKDQVINLLDDLLEIFPSDVQMLAARLYFADQVDGEALIRGFVKYVLPWKEKITNRDEKYFEENEYIFGDIEPGKVKHFKYLIKSNAFTTDDKKILWDYFAVFISLAEKYKKII